MVQHFGAITPVVMIGMVIGIVEAAKRLGLQGNGLFILSLGVGLGLGVLFQLMEMYPGAFSTWARVGIYSVLFALTASGLYDVSKKLAIQVGAAIAVANKK